MIRNPEAKDLLVKVTEAFWNVLFSNKLVMKAVGQTWCFCLNNQDTKKQMIVVYPSSGFTKVPTPTDLAKRFNLRDDGRYLDSQRLPMDYKDLASPTGIYVENVRFAEKELVILYLHYSKIESVSFSDSIINAFEIDLSDESDEYLWPKDPSEMEIMICSENEKTRKLYIFFVSRNDAKALMLPTTKIMQNIRLMQRMRQQEVKAPEGEETQMLH